MQAGRPYATRPPAQGRIPPSLTSRRSPAVLGCTPSAARATSPAAAAEGQERRTAACVHVRCSSLAGARRFERAAGVIGAAAADAAEEGEEGALACGGERFARWGDVPLTPPAQRLQPALSSKERSALRTEAERMVAANKMVVMQLGAAGLTPAVLASALGALLARGFVRMRTGVGGRERKALAADLAELLDAEVVQQVGFTVTLYREKGLPHPEGGSASSAA